MGLPVRVTRPDRVRWWRHAWLLTAAAGAVVVGWGRLGPDWAAQDFRSSVARNLGVALWDNAWYAGHALLGYSVLYPLVSAPLGAALTGLLAATATSAAGLRLLPPPDGVRTPAWIATHLCVALCVLGNLVSGQVTFLLGLAPAAWSVLAVRGRHPWLAGALAAGASLGSPLAGLFVLLVAAAWLPDVGLRRVAPLGAAATGSLVSLAFDGGGGRFPFGPVGWIPYAVFTVLALGVIPRDLRLLRRAVALNAVAAVMLFVVPNPVGANVNRLAQLAALPLAMWMLGLRRQWRIPRARPVVAGLAVAAAATWFAFPVGAAVVRAAGDPSRDAGYYAGVLRFLQAQDLRGRRVEVPPTEAHWESSYIATRVPIARGWERQTDLRYNSVLYRPLTAASYRRWLDDAAVGLVALPDAPLDRGGAAEAALLAHPPPYLRLVYTDAHWSVYRVQDAAPLVSGDARLVRLATSSVTVRFLRPGVATIRLHASDLWRSATPGACVLDGGPWLRVRAAGPGEVEVRTELTASAVLHLRSGCPGRN